jgi:ribonuclease HI
MIWAWLGNTKGLKQSTLSKKDPPLLKEGQPTGWFDGATQGKGQFSGAGGVIKVNFHTTYRWMINCGSGSNTRAKLLGVWALLTLANRLHIYDLQVFGDSRIVID